MVATGILGVIASAGLGLASSTTKVTISENLRNAVDTLESQLYTVFENSMFCKAALTDFASTYGYTHPSPTVLTGTDWLWPSTVGLELSLYVVGAQAGPSGTSELVTSNPGGNANFLPRKGLKIDSLKLQDAVATGSTTVPAGQTEYVGRVFLQVSNINGSQTLKPRHIATILFTRDDGTGKLKSCKSSFLKSAQQVCEDLGCIYTTGDTPPCVCPQPTIACGGPGLYPVGVAKGGLICKPLGGKNCPPGQVLSGIGIGRITCINVDGIKLEFLLTSSAASEGTVHSITLILSEPYPVAVSVDVTPVYTAGAGYADASDIAPSGLQTITIPANTTAQSFTVNIVADGLGEPVESMQFTLSNIVGAGGDIILGPRNTHTLNIGAPTCTTGAHAWPAGCSAPDIGTMAEGATASPSNVAPGYTGSFTWTCPMGGGAAVASGETCTPVPPLTWVDKSGTESCYSASYPCDYFSAGAPDAICVKTATCPGWPTPTDPQILAGSQCSDWFGDPCTVSGMKAVCSTSAVFWNDWFGTGIDYAKPVNCE